MQNQGLILTLASTMPNGLKLFVGVLWTDGGASVSLSRLCESPAAAVQVFLQRYGPGVKWLSGPASSKKLAAAFGLEHRKRAPGGGRKKSASGQKSVSVPVWLTPAGKERLDRHRGKIPRGTYVEGLLPP